MLLAIEVRRVMTFSLASLLSIDPIFLAASMMAWIISRVAPLLVNLVNIDVTKSSTIVSC